MTDYDDGDVLDRVDCESATDPLDYAIESSLRNGFLDLSSVAYSSSANWDDVAQDLAKFVSQCALFSAHPCVRLGDDFIPIDILGPMGVDPSNAFEDALRVWRAAEERVNVLRAHGLETRMLPIEKARSSFRRELKRFIRSRIDALFGDDPPSQSGGDDFRGLRVTVSARTKRRVVVISNSFFFRSEQPFGESLTSPVVGYLPNAGCYYFGLLDGTSDSARWSQLMYEIPPNLTVALHI